MAFTLLMMVFAADNARASSCTPPPSGLIGWWQGEGNTADNIGANNGVAVNSYYTNGVDGQAFAFDPENFSFGTYTGVQIPDQPAYALTNSLTIEGWVRPRGDGYIIFCRGDHRPGLDPYVLSMQGNNTFLFNICDANGGSANVGTTLNYFAWTHVAATLDGSAGTLSIYTNGVLAVQTNTSIRPFGNLLADQSPGIGIGNLNDGGNNFPFIGDIDEISLYNRALSAGEIQTIYNAGGAGKCFTPAPPVISAVNPLMSAPGTTVTISGANFSATASSDIVYFGAVRALVSSASPTNLLVTVPTGATFAPVTVTVNGLVAYSVAAFEPTFTGNGAAIDSATFAPGATMNVASPIITVLGDLDGDGKPDLTVANVYANSISIYQNIATNGILNAASFAPPVVYAVGNGSDNPISATVADVDGDGKLDVLAADRNNNRILIYRNISSGGTLTTNSFAPPIFLTTPADPRRMVVRDLDGDGRPDIIVANNSGTLSIFRNIGAAGSISTNSFAARVDLAMPGNSESVVVGDLDGDGQPDLAAADSSGFISLYRNHCTPGNISPTTFDARVDLPAQSGSLTVVMGDIDGDGKPELITSAYLPQTMSVYRNLSTPGSLTTNSFAAPVDYALAGRGHSIALSDFNGDGKLDIAEVTEISDALSLFQSIGAGGFTNTSLGARVDYAAGWNAWGVAVGDLDGDGRPDAVFGNVYDNTLTIYKNIVPFGTPPVITTQPAGQNVAAGSAVTFAITVQGASPFSCQWSFNGTNLSGATNLSLTLTNLQLNQAGNYAVLVTNLYGMVPSSNAALTVFIPAVPPAILAQTPSQIVLLGNPATFVVNASGSDPLNYFWKRDDVFIPGATNSSYTLLNAQLSDSGSRFSCLVTNVYGFATSTNATLKVIDGVANDLCSGPVVVASLNYTNLQSTAKATSFGDPVPGCITDFGNGVWYQFTAPVNGQLIVDTFGSDFDTGLAIYTGSCDALTELACNDDTGGVNSQVAMLTTAGTTYSILVGGYSSHTGNLVFHLHYLTPPIFAVQPANQSVVVTSNATFSATLTGALPMSFQWYFNGTPLVDNGHVAGSMTTSLSLSNLTTADAGSYTLAATNFLGSASSAAAVLNVLVPPAISTQPVGRSVPPGLPTTFSAAAIGNPAPSYYQWQLNGTNIPGANSASYTITAVNTNHLGFYHLVASNSVGGAVSADAQLTFGQVAAWGRNLNNESLPPPNLSSVVAVAGTFGASFAVRTDGTIAAWGSGTATNLPASASNVVAIATSGATGNYALRSDGRAVGWNGILPPALSNIVAIAAGNNFAYALRAEGTLTNWGGIPAPGFPAGLNHLTAISAGFNNAIALRNDGTIVVSGGSAVTNIPASATNVIAIAAGYSYAMALRADGKVISWGIGTITNVPTSLTNIVAISAGNYSGENFGVAVRADGRVITWGDNGSGETNTPNALTNLVSIAGAAAPFHGLALVNDGSPVIIHPPVGLTTFIGRDVTLHGDAVGAQPLSYQWLLNGMNLPGATNTSLILSNVQFSDAGNYQLFVSNNVSTALSLAAPLTVVSNNTLTILSQQTASQTNYQGSKVTLPGVIVLGNGPLRYQWFFSPTNKNYTAVPGATNETLVMDPALAINTGNYFVAVSNQFGGITNTPVFVRVLFAKAWGTFAADPPFNVTNAIAIAVGNVGQNTSLGHYLVLKSDGKISSWSLAPSSFGETNFAALSNSIVTAIAAGYQDSLALKSDGTVYATGYNIYGETNVPAGLSGVTAIACGDYHDLALKSDGTVTGWGQNSFLLAANAAATNVVAIAAGGQDSMALRADGSVVTWGSFGGQFPIPSNATNIIAIAAGSQHFLALRANGTVIGWGVNSFGQTTIPTNLTNIVAIAAAANHSTLLRNDGTVVTLGNYVNGPASNSIPADLANVIAIAGDGEHDLALFGARAPAFTVQPWNRTFSVNATTNITLAAKCAGVQPMRYQWQLNGTNFPGATNDSITLRNDPPFTRIPSGVYQFIASNAYGVVASKPAKVTLVIPLGDALDATNLNWTTTGNAQWFGQTNYVRPDATKVNASAARSGGIGALQETILQTTFATNVAGSVIFWWKVSSEQFFDTLEFRINGTVQASISGEVDWTQASFPLAAGTNVLMWRYSKDSSFDSGLDAAFVDQFSFAAAPVIITQPTGAMANLGDVVSLRVIATGTPPMHYQWFRNGSPISSGISSTYTMLNVARAQDGVYDVTVTNAGGSVVSSDTVLKVLVPQILGSPKLLSDGTFLLTSADANGGLLSPSDLANFEAQASTNLVDWVSLPNALSLTNGMLQLQDGGQSNYSARYYRILEH